MDIVEVDDILQFRNGAPKSMYLGRIFKNGKPHVINHDSYHFAYNGKWYKFKDQEFIITITSTQNEDGNTVLWATPEDKERVSNLIVRFKQNNDVKYLIFITNDAIPYFTVAERDLTGETYDIEVETYTGGNRDQYWVHKPDKTQITI